MTHTPKRNTEEHTLRMEERRARQLAQTRSIPPAPFYPSATLNRQGEPHSRKREIDRRAKQETVRGG